MGKCSAKKSGRAISRNTTKRNDQSVDGLTVAIFVNFTPNIDDRKVGAGGKVYQVFLPMEKTASLGHTVQ
jgi:hypothetical protein